MKLVLAMVLGVCVQGVAFAQTGGAQKSGAQKEEFAVASVKRAAPAVPEAGGEDAGGGARRIAGAGSVSLSEDTATYAGVTLKRLLMAAYDLKPYQISGPGWIETERCDVEAKFPVGTAKEQIAVMLQHLLADRFQITQHTEMKDEPVYVLAMGPTGPKLKPSSSEHAQAAVQFTIGATGVTGLRYVGNTMADFAANLSLQMGREVTDKTGLAGRFDIALPLDEKDLQSGSLTLASSLLTAVKSVGLKLDPGKVAMKHMVVDSAAKVPTED